MEPTATGAQPTKGPRYSKRIVWWKLATFAVTSGLFVTLQYFVARSAVNGIWDAVCSVFLAHSVVMLTDAVCELFDENAPNWSNVVVGYLLPVEPRGVSSVVMMIGLIAAGALVIQVRGCATPQPGNQSPASQTAPADG